PKMAAANLENRLAGALDPDIASHVAAYMANKSDRSDALEYLAEFIDHSNPKHAALLAELRTEWLAKPAAAAAQASASIRLTPQVAQAASVGLEKKPIDPVSSAAGSTSRRSGDKFVPLFSELGDQIAVAMLPGRHRCDCVATKHSLINNCLGCGRIVCQQEGSGPCMFCGELVASKAETEILARGSKKSDQLRRQLMSAVSASTPPDDAALDAALAVKQKLLEYDRNSARRTKVIDDQMDYFESDGAVWLSDAEKSKLRQRESEIRQQRHKSRLERRLVYDFAGRCLVDDPDPAAQGHIDPEQDDVLREIAEARTRAAQGRSANSDPAADQSGSSAAPSWSVEDFPLANPSIACPPQFVATEPAGKSGGKQQQSSSAQSSSDAKRAALRLQDADLRELRDDGHCLSMHQPWATLLVRGIKVHEGRSWYTAHRGRLWIAATARRPSDEEVAAVLSEYRQRLPDAEFPTAYPTGCLLGCVHVDDVLPQDEYREQFPQGESESPFVLLCSNPRELLLKLPMKGEHKIYRLDKQLHKAALAGLARGGV
ncbi:hypothetical protein BOX15_Mlig024142g4, partial [Macrostomum lignano]